MSSVSGAHLNPGVTLAFALRADFPWARVPGYVVSSMNSARSLGPALVLGHPEAWWAYVVGPFAGAVIAVAFARVLRGRGGGFSGRKAAQGGLGWLWRPGPIHRHSR